MAEPSRLPSLTKTLLIFTPIGLALGQVNEDGEALAGDRHLKGRLISAKARHKARFAGCSWVTLAVIERPRASASASLNCVCLTFNSCRTSYFASAES